MLPKTLNLFEAWKSAIGLHRGKPCHSWLLFGLFERINAHSFDEKSYLDDSLTDEVKFFVASWLSLYLSSLILKIFLFGISLTIRDWKEESFFSS